MDENKNQDWMSIFNDPLNQNNNGGNATLEEGKTEIQNTSSQTVGMGQPVPEGGVVPPQIPASNLNSSAQQSQNSSVNTGIQTNFRPEQTGVLTQTALNQGTTISDSVSVANSSVQGIPELGEVKQQGMEQTPVPQPQPTPPVPSLQSDVQKIDPFPKEAPATVSTQGQIEGMTATTRPSLQQGIPEVVPVPQAFPTPQPTPMPKQPIQPVQEVIPTTNSSQQVVVGLISNNPGIEEPKKTNFPHYENSPSAEKEQKKLRKLMDRPNTRIRRRHRLLLPMIIFLLIVCIGGYFTLNSYGVFGGSSLTCTRTSTTGNVEESLEYQFSFENNKLKSISYQGEYQLLDTASNIERYNFESNKNGVELLSSTYSSLSGVTYTPKISDRYYQIDVTLDLNKTDTQTNITLSGFEDRLSLDTTRKDVLDVVGRERYVCE